MGVRTSPASNGGVFTGSPRIQPRHHWRGWSLAGAVLIVVYRLTRKILVLGEFESVTLEAGPHAVSTSPFFCAGAGSGHSWRNPHRCRTIGDLGARWFGRRTAPRSIWYRRVAHHSHYHRGLESATTLAASAGRRLAGDRLDASRAGNLDGHLPLGHRGACLSFAHFLCGCRRFERGYLAGMEPAAGFGGRHRVAFIAHPGDGGARRRFLANRLRRPLPARQPAGLAAHRRLAAGGRFVALYGHRSAGIACGARGLAKGRANVAGDHGAADHVWARGIPGSRDGSRWHAAGVVVDFGAHAPRGNRRPHFSRDGGLCHANELSRI